MATTSSGDERAGAHLSTDLTGWEPPVLSTRTAPDQWSPHADKTGIADTPLVAAQFVLAKECFCWHMPLPRID